MSQVLEQLKDRFDENPFVTFDSQDNGKSRIYDLEWDFTAQGHRKTKISFKHIQEQHRKNMQSYLFAIIEYQKSRSDSDEHLSVGTLLRYQTNMNKLVTVLGSSDFSLLSDEYEWKRVKGKIKRTLSDGALRNFVATINAMSYAGLVERYIGRKEYSPLARCHTEGQAIAFPERIHAEILIQVVSIIEKYHSFRHVISEVMEKSYQFRDEEYRLELVRYGVTELTEKHARVFSTRISRNVNKMAQSYDIPDFKVRFDAKWMSDLIRHCLICVGLFSGARINEILSFNKSSYDVVHGIPIVNGLTSKGEDGQPIYTTWNTHPIVKQALELAYDVTEYARSRHKLSCQSAFNNGEIDQDKFHRRLEELNGAFISCEFRECRVDSIDRQYQFKLDNVQSGMGITLFNIEATEEDIEEFELLNPNRAGALKLGGTLPKFSPHDLRRSFAVFLVRHRLGNHQTLKYQLKHKNLNMSRWYANYSELARTNKLLMDEELLIECNKAMEEAALDALDDIYNGSTTLSGFEGEKIAEKLRNGEQVYMSREELRALLKSKDKPIVLLPTGGYCTNRDCERLCSMMDVIDNNNCPHKVITDKGAKRMGRERNELIHSFREMNEMGDYAYSTILSARKQKILFIEKTLDDHNIPYEKFTDEIRVVAL